jgi:hypothetical protein
MADDPDAMVQEFLHFTYDTASRLGTWSSELVRDAGADSATQSA